VQRCSSGTLARTCSTCIPHPEYVTLRHWWHTAGLHIEETSIVGEGPIVYP